MLSCAVIGCGAAGMAACASLRQCGLLVTCFELAAQPGGVWARDAHCTTSVRGLPSPLYPALRAALPKDLMSFSDVRYDYAVAQYPHHTAVRHYLQRYAEHKGIHAMTRYHTKVEAVRYDATARVWRLTTVNVQSGDIMQWSFDRVCVCTGHAHALRWPAQLRERVLRDYVDAGGEVCHAAQVKAFRAWRGRRVVVIGDGLCARDYCAELCCAGAQVYHCSSSSSSSDRCGASATAGPAVACDGASTRHHGVGSDARGDRNGCMTTTATLAAAMTAAAVATAAPHTTTPSSLTSASSSSSSVTRRLLSRAAQLSCATLTPRGHDADVDDNGSRGASATPYSSSSSSSLWSYRRAGLTSVVPVGFPVRSDGRGIVFAALPHATSATSSSPPPSPTTSMQQRRSRVTGARSNGAATAACAANTNTTTTTDAADAAAAAEHGVFVDDIAAVLCATGYVQRFAFLEPTLRRSVELLANGAEVDATGSPQTLLLPPHLTAARDDAHAPRPDDTQDAAAAAVAVTAAAAATSSSSSPSSARRAHLYLGTVYMRQPSLAFVGLQRGLLPPNLLFEAQSRLVAFAFTQRLQLPPVVSVDGNNTSNNSYSNNSSNSNTNNSSNDDEDKTTRALAAHEQQLLQHNVVLRAVLHDHPHHDAGVAKMGVHSALYYNALQAALGVHAPDTFATAMRRRWRWLLLSTLLRVVHKCRSWAPLQRKKQHILFSNDV